MLSIWPSDVILGNIYDQVMLSIWSGDETFLINLFDQVKLKLATVSNVGSWVVPLMNNENYQISKLLSVAE